ncbi:MAG: tetratricopeptide repeat protein [Terriglobales bacterium]
MKRPLILALLTLLLAAVGAAQSASTTSQTLLILPFENRSKAPGLDWIGEAFPEVLGQRMGSSALYVVPREDRNYAFDRAGIPVSVRPSHATLFRIGEQMDADYLVFGHYNFDGQQFIAEAQLLDVKRLRLSPTVTESGPLPSLIDVQTALAWKLLRIVRPDYDVTRQEFLTGSPEIRLDAFENYVRGMTAISRQEKLRRLREAIRLNPAYTLAIMQLGRTHFAGREYESAANWFSRVPKTAPEAREAAFYAGLSYYYIGEFTKAENAFSFLASQFPLTEVYNNVGVATARRGKNAIEYFQKATETDPSDPDYHFNLALALYRTGDTAGAARQLTEALKLRPTDAEARSFLEAVNTNSANGRLPLERIKRNYDETSFRQLALEIQNATEARLAKTDPRTHAAYHVERGSEFLRQRFLLDARREFREAIVLDPTNAAAHAGLAAVLEASNDMEGARKELATALKLQPTAQAYVVQARLNLRENKLEAASQDADMALGLQPSNADAQALKRIIAGRMAAKPQQP